MEITRRNALKAAASVGALTLVGGRIARAAEFSEDELCYMPASLQLQLFRRGVLSPVDVLEAQIARIGKYEEKVNAITYTHFDEARKSAKESEARWKAGKARALEGITCGVKDEHGLKGWTMTQGSKLYKDNKLAESDPMAEFLSGAGAILHVQTTVPEFYLHFCTWTDLWGVTRNPWNLEYSVGASSGGSGAALAAGFCTLATGSDMGGSIRLPAAWNGLYGFKPPYGRVPTELPLAQFSGSGPMARTFEDMVRMQNVIAHPHRTSVTTMPHQKLPLRYAPIEGMRIAYVPDQGWAEVDGEARAGTDAAVEVLRGLGAKVDLVEAKLEIEDRWISELFAKLALSGSMGGGMLGNKDKVDQMTTYARYFTNKAASGKYGPAEAAAAERKTRALHAAYHDMIWSKGYDVVINPTIAMPHTPADYDYTTAKPTINGKPVHPLAGPVLTPIYNFLNWYPVVNVPVGRTSKNVPLGMQIVANSYQDQTAMRVASAFEGATPRWFQGEHMPDFRAS
ncbi:MAG: amidase [Planctomycetota bacterium]